MPETWPARQKNPGGQGCCVVFATSAGQKKPALHCALMLVILPFAKQTPEAHGVQLAAPAALKKPTSHRSEERFADVVPDGQ